jgi:hypothetical protein
MAMTKGTDVVSLRSEVRARGGEFEQQYRDALSPPARSLYDEALAFSWSPVEDQMEVYQSAARLLFPAASEPMADLGRALARRTYTGIYRAFLRIPSIKFIMSRAASMWDSFYDTGTATVESTDANSAELVVRGFPGMPAPMREMVKGHMSVLLEMTGARNPSIRHIAANPSEWRWHASWE